MTAIQQLKRVGIIAETPEQLRSLETGRSLFAAGVRRRPGSGAAQHYDKLVPARGSASGSKVDKDWLDWGAAAVVQKMLEVADELRPKAWRGAEPGGGALNGAVGH